MSLDPGAVGRVGPQVEVSWSERDSMLYALAVGAGAQDPSCELQYTTNNTRSVQLRALPTQVVTLDPGRWPEFGSFDRRHVLHAEHCIDLVSEFPPSGRAWVSTKVESMFEKGTAALVWLATDAREDGDRLLWSSRMALHIRDAGGFGGATIEPDPSSSFVRSEPDRVIDCQTTPNQALLYRLTGDGNPLHSDPERATAAGFSRPILHGLCSYGMVARAVLGECDVDPARLQSLCAKFKAAVVPGESLRVAIWLRAESIEFDAFVGERLVLDGGTLTLR